MTAAIITKRLLLIPFNGNLQDINTQVSWLSDPKITQYSEQRHKRHSVASQCEYIESFYFPDVFRAIMLSGQMIGTITARVDRPNKVAEMGILIGDAMKWGHGFGTEAWLGLMDNLFSMGIRKIEAGCMEINQPMLKIFIKSSMKKEGRREAHFAVDDYFCGMELWGRLSE